MISQRPAPGVHGSSVTSGGPRLPIPPRLDGSALHACVPDLPHTALADGVRETVTRFRSLHAAGRLDTRDLPS